MAVQLAVPVTGLVAWAKTTRAAAPVANAVPTPPVNDVALRSLFGTAPDGSVNLPVLAQRSPAYDTAVGQLRAGQYAAAAATLRSITPDSVTDADETRINDVMGKADRAARSQNRARKDLDVARQADVAGQVKAAATAYRAAAKNPFADDDTRREAADGGLRLLADGDGRATPVIHADVPAGTAAPANAIAQATPAPAGPDLAPATPAPAPAATDNPTTGPTVSVPAPAPAAPTAPAMQQPTAAPTAPAADNRTDGKRALDSEIQYQDIRRQQQQYLATVLVAKANRERDANQKQDALADYTEAATQDPQNQQAQEGRRDMQIILGVGQQNNTGVLEKSVKVRRESIQYEFNSQIGTANANIAAGKFNEAQGNINQANVASKRDPTLFTTPEQNDFDTTIQNTQVSLERSRAARDTKVNADAQTKTLKDLKDKQQRSEEERQAGLATLIQSARSLGDQGRYREELGVIDQILRVDPTNQYALGVRQLVLDKATELEQREYGERFNREFEKVLNAAQEAEIPYSDIIHYSDDWPALSEMRDQEVKEDRGEADDQEALTAQLNRHIATIDLKNNALAEVFDYLRDVSGVNIYVDWKTLEAANITRDAQVTARLRDVKFSKALELIFKSVEGDDDEHKLGYTVDEGVITISTRKELNKNTITRRYDINDLLFVAPDYTGAPSLNLQTAGQGQQGGQGGGGGSQQNIFNNTQGQNQNADTGTREQRIDEIKAYVQQNVDPNSWKDNGGEVGSVSSSPLRAILLITQTPENHRKIVSVLDSLRASQALQVSIETRFLTVQRNYLEDIGVDADFTFNPLQNPADPRSGYNSSRFSPISITQNAVTDNSTFVDANGNTVASSATGTRLLDWVSSVGNGAVPGSIAANPADYPNPIVIRGSYIDNLTVSFLIRAVEANQNTTALTAPRLTLFSGQRALLVVETQQAYVSDLNPVVAPGAALFDPVVSTTVATGVVLSVQATVSPDRKYVFMNLEPQLARLRQLANFTVSAVVTPTTTAGGIITGSNQIIQGTIQLPTIDVTQVKTSCSVPDGATLLLGGQTLAGETVREQGVPVLSKIPFLKRLFTNRATSQDEQILLILVKPTILIQREQEQKQFPSLTNRSTGNAG